MKCYIPVYDEDGTFTEDYKFIGEFDTPHEAAVYVQSVLGVDPGKLGIFTEDECIWSDADVL